MEKTMLPKLKGLFKSDKGKITRRSSQLTNALKIAKTNQEFELFDILARAKLQLEDQFSLKTHLIDQHSRLDLFNLIQDLDKLMYQLKDYS